METSIYESSHSTATIAFLSSFKLVGQKMAFCEGKALGLLPFFMEMQFSAILKEKIQQRTKLFRRRQEERTLITYDGVMNYFLEAYVTDEPIAESEEIIIRSSQLQEEAQKEYAELLWMKYLRSNRVQHETVL